MMVTWVCFLQEANLQLLISSTADWLTEILTLRWMDGKMDGWMARWMDEFYISFAQKPNKEVASTAMESWSYKSRR